MASQTVKVLFGSSPSGGGGYSKLQLALYRALRTLIQGVAAAFPAAGAGTVVLSTGYWAAFGYSLLTALVSAIVSFLNNAATILPQDPTQQS